MPNTLLTDAGDDLLKTDAENAAEKTAPAARPLRSAAAAGAARHGEPLECRLHRERDEAVAAAEAARAKADAEIRAANDKIEERGRLLAPLDQLLQANAAAVDGVVHAEIKLVHYRGLVAEWRQEVRTWATRPAHAGGCDFANLAGNIPCGERMRGALEAVEALEVAIAELKATTETTARAAKEYAAANGLEYKVADLA